MDDLHRLRKWLADHKISEKKAIDPITRFFLLSGLLRYPCSLDNLFRATALNAAVNAAVLGGIYGYFHIFVQPLELTPRTLFPSVVVCCAFSFVLALLQRRTKNRLGIPDRKYFSANQES